MKCPKREHDNPSDALFCNKCGTKLEIVCTECGKTNPPGSGFCNKCGNDLTIPTKPAPTDLSFDEKIAKIQRYLPEGLTEKILSQRDRIEGERKRVTVMFCDMEGFTALTERLGPEEAYSIMDQVYEILIHKVHDYEGTVNEMTGDGIVALFGAPIALEDAPQRAIRSAMAIHREMTSLSERMGKEKAGIPSLKMRVGIHSGPVVVGTLGNDLRVEFKAVGETVNLASRMEGLAKPGTTYVTGDTFELTEGLFRFEALGKKQVKGREEPVNVYQAIAPSTRRTRFDVSAERGLTPFVGRERELELLLDGYERAKSGRGQAFSIVAEAGVGKSRLLYEFRKAVSSEDTAFLEGRCLSYGRGIAYHPVIDVLKASFDIQEDDSDLQISEKVKSGLEGMGADQVSTLPYLLELLSVEDSGIDKSSVSLESRRDRVLEAVKRVSLHGSELRPLIMAFEDLHWMDRSSEEALKSLLDSIPGARILLIFTYRPEFLHTWAGKSYHSQLNLIRLSNRESLSMMTHLLGTSQIDTDLGELILDKTEGVPFFIEEFVKSLKDLKIIELTNQKYSVATDAKEVSIPSTIQDVIMARVDSLPDKVKEVLQTGAVIDREFRWELIRRVTELSESELLSRLSFLKDSELIYERGIYPQTTYTFKHALTQEVVYDSILSKRRKKLHADIGRAIEELYRESISEHYAVLSEHFIAGEDYENGAKYSRLTTKKFEKTGSMNGAIAFGEKAVACLERLPETNDVLQKLIDARTALGLHHTQLNYHLEARQAVEPIVNRAVELGYKKRLSQIYTILGAYNCFAKEDCDQAVKYGEEALRISQELKDSNSQVFANFWIALPLAYNCEFGKALSNMKQALAIYRKANGLWGASITRSMMSFYVYFYQGAARLGYETSKEAIQIAEESGDTHSKSFAYGSHGISCCCLGSFEEAASNLQKSIYLAESIGWTMFNADANTHVGEVYYDMGEHEKSGLHHLKAAQLLEKNGLLPSLLRLSRMGVARAKVTKGERDIDVEALYACIEQSQNGAKIYEGWMKRILGEILYHIGDQRISEAENWIGAAIEADRRNDMLFHLGKDYACYAELFKRKGDQSKAKENLVRAIDIYKECGADGWVERAEKELALLS